MLNAMIRFSVRNPVLVLVFTAAAFAWGWSAWTNKTVDAIPDISENQVIVDAAWPGRSPKDVEDQVTFPLSTRLAGVKGVKEVRGLSGFGFSRIYVVFDEPIRLFERSAIDDFYESRTRVLEHLATVASDLPPDVTPELGPDATALGQIFMYTVDGPYDLATLRSVQDFVVKYELQAVPGVAEVASVGGQVREYQIDVDPDKMRHYHVGIAEIAQAIRRANLDVGAKTLEQGGEEAILHGLGFIDSIRDIEEVPILTHQAMTPDRDARAGLRTLVVPRTDGGIVAGDRGAPAHRPVLVRDVATVKIGPAFRRGALADGAGERTGGIVTMRLGANPRDVIEGVRAAILRMNEPANSILPPGVRIVPFYDRTQLIDETVETLETALGQELWITMFVVLVFLLHLRSALVISVTLPLAVISSFVLMDLTGVASNIMSLTGIAIAIGTMVDMGVVMTENIYQRLQADGGARPRREVIEEAACEVGPALLTAVATTVISFIPILFLTDQEGKLFRPLAWTKTFALGMAAIAGVFVVPVLCRLFLREGAAVRAPGQGRARRMLTVAAVASLLGFVAARLGLLGLEPLVAFAVVAVLVATAVAWMMRERLVPIDDNPVTRAIHGAYRPTMRWILDHKLTFLSIPLLMIVVGLVVAIGLPTALRPVRAIVGDGVDRLKPVAWLSEKFGGIGQEFMPPLDEGSLLYMPSLLPRASLDEALAVMQRQNAQMERVPEVAKVMGKLGRAETALDPAPVGMFETIVVLKPRSEWRPGKLKRDIVNELMRVAHTPGAAAGPGAWLQPIETRVVMLSSDVRAPLAIRLIGSPRDASGRTLDAKEGIVELERVAAKIRDVVAAVPGAAGPNVENLGGKPYIEFEIDRERAAHYGVSVGDVQDVIATAIGGMVVGQTLEGRERYGIRVAYERERRDRLESLDRVLVRTGTRGHVPLSYVATAKQTTGPAMIKTVDGRLRLHVMFAARDRDERSVVLDAMSHIRDWRQGEIAAGRVDPIPAGVSVEPAGRYESQKRARDRFMVLIPICFALILLLLYLKFNDWLMTVNVLLAVPVCVAGGVVLMALFPDLKDAMFAIGLWDQPSTGPVYFTVAVVVGFIALAGIATDDGVVIGAFLEQSFRERKTDTIRGIRDATIEAGLRRIRPCLMTTATTILALYPILASTGRGSDVAQPMAIPAVGGMIAGLVSLFIVPCVYCWVQEVRLKRSG